MQNASPNIRIDAARLWGGPMETARIGGTERGGIARPTLTESDRQVRDWFRREVEALGCTVTMDEVGSMFASRPGRGDDLDPIAIGSHLATRGCVTASVTRMQKLGGTAETRSLPPRSRIHERP